MADPNVQDSNAGTTTEEASAAQQELPPTIESQPSDASEVNGAAGGAPAEPLPADAAAPISPDNLPASEAPAPDAQDSAAPSDVAQASPAAEPAAEPAADTTAEAAPATGANFATGIGMEAPASEAVTGPSFGGSDTANAAPSEPAADAAPAGAQPDTEAAAAPLAPGADASNSGGDLSPLPESGNGESPAPAGELSTTSTESPSPSEEAAAEGDKELPYNNVGMAQLGTAGIDEAGAPVEHPAPATTPAPIDPTTGNQLGEEDHKAVTGGEDYKEILSVKGPEDTDATNGVVAEHPAPAKTPTPIDPTSGLPLSDEDHKTVTGGLEKGTEVEVPVAPVNTDDGKAVEGGAATGATDGIPSAFSGSEPSLGGDVGQNIGSESESSFEEIKGFIEQKFNSVFHKLKHLEHEMHEALRNKRR